MACGLAAAVSLHAIALALLPAVAPTSASSPGPVASSASHAAPMQVALLGPLVASMRAPATAAVPAASSTAGTSRSFASRPLTPAARRSPDARRPDSAIKPGVAARDSAGPGVTAAAAVEPVEAIEFVPSPAPSGPSTAGHRTLPGEIAFREQWELDEPPQFLHVPAELAELIEMLAAPVDARVALFIDARGRVARVEIGGMIDADSSDALVRALQAAVFAPGRLGAGAVASVKRFEMRGLGDGMRVVTAATASTEP